MSHLDDETIALAAIGEDLDQAASDHLLGCDGCRTQVDALTLVVSTARSARGEESLLAPPPAIWARIAAETGVDPGLLPTSIESRRGAADRDASGAGAPTALSGSGRRAGLRPGLLVAASVASLLLGIGGTLIWQAVDDDATVIASASLAPLPDKVGSGEAEVVDTSAGRELELTLDTAAPADAFLQVWLLSPDASRMVPVGVLAGDSGQWTLPPDVTLADYPVVDVSIEPYDGEAAHSGNSVVRGELDLSATAVGLLD